MIESRKRFIRIEGFELSCEMTKNPGKAHVEYFDLMIRIGWFGVSRQGPENHHEAVPRIDHHDGVDKVRGFPNQKITLNVDMLELEDAMENGSSLCC